MRWDVIFLSAILFLLTSNCLADSDGLPPLPETVPEAFAKPISPEYSNAKQEAALKYEASKASFRDPTMPLDYQMISKVEELIVLNSILISKYRKVAVLNGVVVNEGSHIKNYKVVTIDKKQVILRSKSKSIVLLLRQKASIKVRQPISSARNSNSIMKNITQGGQ